MLRIFSHALTIAALAALLTLPVAPAHASLHDHLATATATATSIAAPTPTDTRGCMIPDRRKRRAYGAAAGAPTTAAYGSTTVAARQFEVGGELAGRGQQCRRAVAAVAGLAILGAIIAHHDREQDGDGVWPPAKLPGGRRSGPGMGDRNIQRKLWGQRQTIQIGPDGGVNVWYRNGGSAQRLVLRQHADDRRQRDERATVRRRHPRQRRCTSDADHP